MATLATTLEQPINPGIVNRSDALTDYSIERISATSLASGRWTYLISNQYQLDNKTARVMHLPLPDETTLYHWLVKLITARQVGCIVVDALALERYQISLINSLCHQYRVVMINLEGRNLFSNQVVYGPW